MKWCVVLVLVGVCGAQDPVEAELARLRERVAQLEEQRQAQEEVNGLLLRAMDATTEKLDLFLRAVQDGGLQAQPVTQPVEAESPEGESGGWGTALAVSGLALGFALLAWWWNRRSVVVVEGGAQKGEPDVGFPVLMDGEIVTTANGKRSEAVDLEKLDVEQVGVGELGLENVLPVELAEAREDAGSRNEAPCRVQWKLTCANPAVGEKLVLDLFAREPRVLAEPAPRVEAQGHSLRIGYHVHPGLPVAERTQIAARLTEVLEGVPPESSRSGGPVR